MYHSRSLCGLPAATSFSELSDTLSPQQIKQLAAVYASVEDVDLYIGGLMETRTRGGGRLGHTFSCIIADQVWLL